MTITSLAVTALVPDSAPEDWSNARSLCLWGNSKSRVEVRTLGSYSLLLSMPSIDYVPLQSIDVPTDGADIVTRRKRHR